MDPTPSSVAVPAYSLGPQAPYLARPAPIHYGDMYGADQGFATVYQTGGGYDVVNGVADADVAMISGRANAAAGARLASTPVAANWLQTAGAGALVLVALAWWLEARG